MGVRNHTSEIINTFLTDMVVIGLVPLVIVAPNSLVALEKPISKLLNGRSKQRESRRIAQYIKQQKLVKITPNSDGSFQIELTKNGKTRAKRVYFEQLEIPVSKWDKKWRILMFDIPEKYKTSRDYLSFHLKRIGFKQLQRSVFVYPYPVDEFVELVRELFPEVERNIIYLTTTDIDAHNALVRQFKTIIK